ncbi:MAG: hypothetical protein G01um1014106_103 [Parcubacteria group bacterium Gr01-1014_106]|nr:MAG: hypothetical protein G01um1014106_103 [Parcubacteria group bacterium Gr01-1014_106]
MALAMDSLPLTKRGMGSINTSRLGTLQAVVALAVWPDLKDESDQSKDYLRAEDLAKGCGLARAEINQILHALFSKDIVSRLPLSHDIGKGRQYYGYCKGPKRRVRIGTKMYDLDAGVPDPVRRQLEGVVRARRV